MKISTFAVAMGLAASASALPVIAAETVAKSGQFNGQSLLILLGVFVAPVVAGYLLANALRLPDYGWKLALIFLTIVASTAQITMRWPPAGNWRLDA